MRIYLFSWVIWLLLLYFAIIFATNKLCNTLGFEYNTNNKNNSDVLMVLRVFIISAIPIIRVFAFILFAIYLPIWIKKYPDIIERNRENLERMWK